LDRIRPAGYPGLRLSPTPDEETRAALDSTEGIRTDLDDRFQRYRSDALKGISPQRFRSELASMLGVVDSRPEGYLAYEQDAQRDLSIKFHWGHDHDFGDFQLRGRMGRRHIEVLANFVALFPLSIEDFEGRSVFDVGCWTGGTTLLLAALGSRVHAIDEVAKYAETAAFLVRHFGLGDRVRVEPRSLYECNCERMRNHFEIVHAPGVIYHVSDPLLALRIFFNSLVVGGRVLLESEGIDHPEPFCRFDGSRIVAQGRKEEMNRGGWNWFIPSPSALARMMEEAGFEEVRALWHAATRRVYAYGVKRRQHGICKAGLSVRQIP
jgi:SAM-dependent methyltransferase